ncbi:hypothetical protein [Porphyromonas gingivalis]
MKNFSRHVFVTHARAFFQT